MKKFLKNKIYHLFYSPDNISKMDVLIYIDKIYPYKIEFNVVLVNKLSGVFVESFSVNSSDSLNKEDINYIIERGGKIELIGDIDEYPEYFI